MLRLSSKDWFFLFISLLIGGVGVFQPMHTWIGHVLIVIGALGALFVLGLNIFKTRKSRSIELTQGPSDRHEKFPNTEYLTGQDIMDLYGFSPFVLKQHIERGLVAYVNDGDMQNKKLRQITQRELIGDEVFEDDLGTQIGQWLFKTEDLEKYLKNT